MAQRLGGQGPGAVGPDGKDPGSQRRQQVQHVLHILVRQNAQQEHQLLPGEQGLQTLSRGCDAVGIVGAVQQEYRGLPQHLEPPRPADGGKAPPDGVLGDGPALLPQDLQRRDGGGGVAELIGASQRQLQSLIGGEVKDGALQGQGPPGQAGKVHLRQTGTLCRAGPVEHRVRLWAAAVADHVAAGLDDAGLGGGDVRQRGAQKGGVVHAHGGEDGNLRHVDDVGGVQRAAQAHLQHHDVAGLLPEIQQGDGGDKLKFGGVLRHGLRRGADPLRQGGQGLVGDHLSVHLDALVKGHQVGRGVQPHPVSGGPENGRQTGAGAALAVGARHVDEFQPPLGVSQGVEQRPDAAQARLMLLPVEGVDIRDGFLTGHEDAPLCLGQLLLPQQPDQRDGHGGHHHGGQNARADADQGGAEHIGEAVIPHDDTVQIHHQRVHRGGA